MDTNLDKVIAHLKLRQASNIEIPAHEFKFVRWQCPRKCGYGPDDLERHGWLEIAWERFDYNEVHILCKHKSLFDDYDDALIHDCNMSEILLNISSNKDTSDHRLLGQAISRTICRRDFNYSRIDLGKYEY